MGRGSLAALSAAFAMISLSAEADQPALGPDSQRPVPRYVSLATETANGRHGPGLEHQIDWVYQRPNLPLRVTAESGPWRRVIDPDGDEAWIHARNLEERRTVFLRTEAPLRRGPNGSAALSAVLAKGVIGSLTGCEGQWRRMAVGGRVGWVEGGALWGAEDCAGL